MKHSKTMGTRSGAGPMASHVERKEKERKRKEQEREEKAETRREARRVSRQATGHADLTSRRVHAQRSGGQGTSGEGHAVKKTSRYRPGTAALREIRRYQSVVPGMLIPKTPFARLCREIGQQLNLGYDLNFGANAYLALQEASELYLVDLYSDAYMCTTHRKRITLKPEDIYLARRIRGEITKAEDPNFVPTKKSTHHSDEDEDEETRHSKRSRKE